jgi:hypothetical protein
MTRSTKPHLAQPSKSPAAAPKQEAALPIPDHVLEQISGREAGYSLLIRLPLLQNSKQAELELSKDCVQIEAPGIYGRLVVPLPPDADDTRASANFKGREKLLKITLPRVQTACNTTSDAK